MGRDGRTKLPQMTTCHDFFKEVSSREKQVKEHSSDYANKKRHTKVADFRIGDTVLVKQDKKNKLSTTFEHLPYSVTKINGSMITAIRLSDNRSVTRNSSFFKRLKITVSDNDNVQSETEPDVYDLDRDTHDHDMIETQNTEPRQTIDNPIQDVPNSDPDENQNDDRSTGQDAEDNTADRSRFGRVYSKPQYLNDYEP